MTLEWQDRPTHITREVQIGQAELVHGDERVLFQIKPHQADYSALVQEEGLDLLVRVYIPDASRARLEQIAALIEQALYE